MAEITRWQRRLSPLLAPLGLAYGRVMRARRGAYASGRKASMEPGAPTVSVGNIAWGGTGKTPLTHWLCAWAGQRDLTPVVLTRGYKARPPAPHYLVRLDSPVEYAGDEPLELVRACARSCPQARVVVDPVRSRAAVWAAREFSPHLFVLDDGFQHMAVRRDLDLVLLRPADLARDWGKVIPAGPWREPASALDAAHAFLIKASPGAFQALERDVRGRLEGLGRPVFSFDVRAAGVWAAADPGADPGTDAAMAGTPFVLVTATGDPSQVLRSVAEMAGRDPQRHLAFADHHGFTETDWADIRAAADQAGARAVLCTPKDAVKLEPLAMGAEPERLYVVRPEVVFGPAMFTDQDFPAWFTAWWERK